MYIANQKIKSETKLDNGYILVEYEPLIVEEIDKTFPPEIYSEKVLSVIKTEEPSDFTTVRDKKITPLAEQILKELLEWNVSYIDIEPLFQLIIDSLTKHKEEAICKMFTIKDDRFLTLLHVHETLMK